MWGNMFKILYAEFLAPGIKRFVIQSPRIAYKQKPGQFVILRLHEQGERIPITIEHSDPKLGTMASWCSRPAKLLTRQFAEDWRQHSGRGWPAGEASDIEKFGDRVATGGGEGTAMVHPTAVALKQGGQRRDLHRRRAQ